MSLDDQVKSYVYYRTLGTCLVGGGPNLKDGAWFEGGERINREHAKDGDWFAQAQAPGGVFLDGVGGVKARVDTGGAIECAQRGLVTGALTLWDGWAPDEALCSIGMRRASDAEFNAKRCTDQQGGSDEFKRDSDMLTKFRRGVSDRIYGGKEPTVTANTAWTDAGKYLLYLKTFKTVCAPNATVTTTRPTGTTDTDYVLRLPSRSDTTVIFTTTYYTGLQNKSQNDVATIVAGSSLSRITGTESMRCGALVRAINGDKDKKNGLADAYGKWLREGTDNDSQDGGKDCSVDASCPEEPSTCAIDGIGWMLCPVLTAGAAIADSAYDFLANSFLETNVGLVNTDPNRIDPTTGKQVGTGAYIAWGIMRSIANVAFIIVFLVAIFSQMTSAGISNYGVKKMLPRLIVGAILVNVSFFICQIAVDVSNILGYSLKSSFEGVASQVNASTGGAAATPGNDSGNLVGITATVLGAAAFAWINAAALIVAVTGAVVSLLTIFVILIVRQVLIVLLIVIAPLAFVAYLLPNTQPLFNKWRKMLTPLLLLFPLIGMLYGASILASAIILQIAGDDVVWQIAGYMALVIPLIAIFPLLKGAVNGVGKLGGAIQSFGSKARSSAQSGAQKGYDRSRLGQFKKYRTGVNDRRRAQIAGGTFEGSNRNPLNWARNARSAVNKKVVNPLSGQFGQDLAASGAELVDQEAEREIKSATALMTQQGLSSGELTELAHGREVIRDGKVIMRAPDDRMRQAAVREKMRTGTTGEVEQLLKGSGTSSARVRQEMARGIHANGHAAKADYLGGDFADRVLRGEIRSDSDLDDAAARRIEGGKLSAETMVAQDSSALERIARVSGEASAGTRTDITGPQIDRLRDTAVEATTNDQYRARISGQKANPIDLITRL